MKTLKILALAALALSIAVACSSDATQGQKTDHTARIIADFNLPSDCGIRYEKMQHDSLYVINSEAEWANLFTCEGSPSINFSTQTLLSVWGGVPNGIGNISKELLFENNTWSLTVDITLDLFGKSF
jgi:hypothetical protein